MSPQRRRRQRRSPTPLSLFSPVPSAGSRSQRPNEEIIPESFLGAKVEAEGLFPGPVVIAVLRRWWTANATTAVLPGEAMIGS